MLKKITYENPAYVEIGFKDGQAVSVNGKELNYEGVCNVISYICNEVNTKADEVINIAKTFAKEKEDIVTLKLFNGSITRFN